MLMLTKRLLVAVVQRAVAVLGILRLQTHGLWLAEKGMVTNLVTV